MYDGRPKPAAARPDPPKPESTRLDLSTKRSLVFRRSEFFACAFAKVNLRSYIMLRALIRLAVEKAYSFFEDGLLKKKRIGRVFRFFEHLFAEPKNSSRIQGVSGVVVL